MCRKALDLKPISVLPPSNVVTSASARDLSWRPTSGLPSPEELLPRERGLLISLALTARRPAVTWHGKGAPRTSALVAWTPMDLTLYASPCRNVHDHHRQGQNLLSGSLTANKFGVQLERWNCTSYLSSLRYRQFFQAKMNYIHCLNTAFPTRLVAASGTDVICSRPLLVSNKLRKIHSFY